MGAFLSVTRGSVEVPWLLELRLNMVEGEERSEEEKPIVLVGKGGISCFLVLCTYVWKSLWDQYIYI